MKQEKFSQTRSFFKDFLGRAPKKNSAHAEKARLEAFLAAVPAAYCGWAADGSVAYSPSFCEILEINSIQSIDDVQACLSISDSAALEGLFVRLHENGVGFTLTAQDITETRSFKITGVQGKDPYEQARYSVLWLEDVTQQNYAHNVFVQEQNLLHGELDRLQDSLDALPHPIWIRDAEQKITWCNVAYAKKVDASTSEIIAQQKEIAPARRKKPGEKDILMGAELARLALETGQTQTAQSHLVLGGARTLMRITEIPVRARQITLGMAEDLSEEDRIRAELKTHMEAQKALMEHLRSAIGIYGADHRLSFYNSAFAQLWHLEEGWLNTQPKLGEIMEKLREMRRLPEQADFRKFKQTWLDMFTALIEPQEDMLHLPDGTALRMLVVPHKAGGLMMTFEDVTSRLSLESSYNTLVAVQRETLDNLDEAVTVYGGDGRLKLWNPSFARLWRIDPEALDGEPHITKILERMREFFAPEAWPAARDLLMNLALERIERTGRLERQDRALVDYATVPLPDGGVLITYGDVTDTVRVETALREKNAALEAAEHLKQDFLANVSYQLRTPLNAIMGFNELLDKQFFGPLNDKQREYTRDIQNASDRLLGLINDILDLATIEAGYLNLAYELVTLKPLLVQVTDLVRDWARKGGVELILTCGSDLGEAELDPARVKQALVNLLRNAISHTPRHGKITVAAQRNDSTIEIKVTDTGSGIKPEDQARILQPFERVENAPGAERGVGLGLTLVQNITALHGGHFELQSALGQGTSVSMTLPIRRVQSRSKNAA